MVWRCPGAVAPSLAFRSILTRRGDAWRDYGARTRRPLNRYGISHLSFHVEDVDAVAEKIRRFGGEVHDHTRTTIGKPGGAPDFVYCSDPDGTRIELMKLA